VIDGASLSVALE